MCVCVCVCVHASTAPGVCVCVCMRASTAPGVCVCVCVRACVHCSRCVCALGWVKYREHILLLIILCIIRYVKKNIYIFFFTKPITDYGKMLKYREKYRSISTAND